MSLKVTSLVWEAAPIEDARVMMVLLALSDWANDEGVSWYSVAKIARKSRCSERTAQRIIQLLSKPDDSGYQMLHVHQRGGRRLTNVYRVNVRLLRQLRSQLESELEKGDTVTPFVSSNGPNWHKNGDMNDLERVTSSAQNGDTALTPESSERLSERLSGEAAAQAPLPQVEQIDVEDTPLSPEELSQLEEDYIAWLADIEKQAQHSPYHATLLAQIREQEALERQTK